MRAVILAIGSVLILLSCAGRYSGTDQDSIKSPSKIPVKLVYEREISGRILAYDLQHPSGIAVDARGNLYISDTGNHRLIKLDSLYDVIRDYGGYGSGVGKFLSPENIVIDRNLNLYVLDTGNRRIVHLDAKFNFVDEIFPDDDPEEIVSNRGELSGLQISSLGEITVADYDNSRLIRMDNFNRFSRYIGDFGYGRGALLNPRDMTVDRDGRSYVADAGNGRIAVYDDYGNYLFEVGAGQLPLPTAIAVSPYNAVWVADGELQAVFAFSPDGKSLVQTIDYRGEEFEFSGIEAIAVSPDGKLYLADSGHNRIMVYSIVYEADQ
jgi:DNA-binding beta-propeller fold protein YncE